MLMTLRTFWSVWHGYFAFCCHEVIFFSKNVLIDRDYEKIPTSEACVCLSLFDLCS